MRVKPPPGTGRLYVTRMGADTPAGIRAHPRYPRFNDLFLTTVSGMFALPPQRQERGNGEKPDGGGFGNSGLDLEGGGDKRTHRHPPAATVDEEPLCSGTVVGPSARAGGTGEQSQPIGLPGQWIAKALSICPRTVESDCARINEAFSPVFTPQYITTPPQSSREGGFVPSLRDVSDFRPCAGARPASPEPPED